MKKLKKMALLVFLLSLSAAAVKSLAQSTMTLHLTNGNAPTYSLTAYSKIYFLNTDFIFQEINTSTPINSIRKITFATSTGLKNVTDTQTKMSVYPNPVRNYISFKNVPDEMCSVSIFSITGAKIITTQLNPSSETLNVSTLTKGIYLVKINNVTAKFIKL